MRVSENRVLAWAVLAVCVVGSIFGMGGGSVAREREKLENLFYQGAESSSTTRYSMDRYLDDASEAAQTMASEADLRLESNSGEIAEMQSLADVIANSKDLDERYTAYTTLKKDADTLYNAMVKADITGDAFTDFKVAYDDFFGADKYILKDSYRSEAAKFNESLNGFAGFVTGFIGVDKLNTFGAQ